MKSILNWFVLLVSIASLISSCKSPDGSSSADNSPSSTSSGLFITIGDSGTLLTSQDGITWTSRTSGTSKNLRSIAFDGINTLVAVGFSGTILSSSDGTTWTSRTSGTTKNINNVFYGNSKFFAVGDNGTTVQSSDGISWINWTSNCGANDNESLWDIGHGNGTWVTVGDNGSIYTSDESSCTLRTSGTTVELNELYYGNSTFVALGDNGTILSSTDGITWTKRISGTTDRLYSGIYRNSNFVAVGMNGTLLTASDATSSSTWTSNRTYTQDAYSTTSVNTHFYGIAYGNSIWVIIGQSGNIYTTSDENISTSMVVNSRSSGTTENLRKVFLKTE